MEQNQNQDPSEENQLKYIDALNRYDRDKKDLMDYMGEIAANGFDEFDPGVSAAYVHNASRSFAKAVTALRESSSDIADPQLILRQLWVADDQERVAYYRTLTGDETHKFVAEDELDNIVNEIFAKANSYDELEEQVIKSYRMYLGMDTKILLGKLQGIYGVEDDEDESDIDLYEQGPEVLELVNKLEKIACRESEGFREGYEDGVKLSRKTTDLDGEFTTEFILYGERAHVINEAGVIETHTEYCVGSKIEYTYDGIESLPAYVRDFLCDIAQDEESGLRFSLEDLTDENNIFILQFVYSVTARMDGTLWPYIDLSLLLEHTDLPIPDMGGVNPESLSPDEISEATDDERVFLESIFSNEELSEITNSISETPVVQVEQDFIEAFRRNIASIKFATTQQHIAMACSLANEFKQKKKH